MPSLCVVSCTRQPAQLQLPAGAAELDHGGQALRIRRHVLRRLGLSGPAPRPAGAARKNTQPRGVAVGSTCLRLNATVRAGPGLRLRMVRARAGRRLPSQCQGVHCARWLRTCKVSDTWVGSGMCSHAARRHGGSTPPPLASCSSRWSFPSDPRTRFCCRYIHTFVARPPVPTVDSLPRCLPLTTDLLCTTVRVSVRRPCTSRPTQAEDNTSQTSPGTSRQHQRTTISSSRSDSMPASPSRPTARSR